MRRGTQHESRRQGGRTLLLLCALLAGVLLVWAPKGLAQTAPVAPPIPTGATAAPPLPALPPGSTPSVAQSQAGATKIVQPTLPSMPPVEGETVDQVVAIVNGQLILDSDVERERRFAALLPYGEASGPYNRDEALERLINRDLILQQTEMQPGDQVTLQAAAADLDALRKSIPTCAQYHCETQEGWDKFLASEGFTEQSLTSLWQQRMEVLAFIELRFRMGIRITPAEIQDYYTKTMLPQYAAQHAKAPPVATISKRIQQVLLQQRVSKLLDDWLSSLRAQGNVVVLHAGNAAGGGAR
jgi:peptidyl-prolyl cis-trans isomerase SurA